jgi:archaellum component FlaF (FlaF/FlaG flagellin family)
VGFAVAASAAIVFAAVAVAGTQATATLLDTWTKADAAQREGLRLAEGAARTEVTVTSVTRDGGNGLVTVLSTNSGSVTLDSREVDVVSDGTLQALSSAEVEGSATKYAWAPGLELAVTYTAGADPSDVAVVPATGTPGYWRG